MTSEETLGGPELFKGGLLAHPLGSAGARLKDIVGSDLRLPLVAAAGVLLGGVGTHDVGLNGGATDVGRQARDGLGRRLENSGCSSAASLLEGGTWQGFGA